MYTLYLNFFISIIMTTFSVWLYFHKVEPYTKLYGLEMHAYVVKLYRKYRKL